MPVLDAHSHYMPPDVARHTMFFKQFWSDLDRHLHLMDAHGIEASVLLYPTSDAHIQMGGWPALCEVYNPAIADAVSKHPGRFIGGGILPVDEPSAIAAELKRIRDLGLKILSLASSYDGCYLDHEMFFEVYEFAAKHAMPVHVHPQIMNPIGEERLKDPLLSPVLEYVFDVSVALGRMMMSGVFLKFPDVKFIFAHYGGVLPVVKERFDTTYQMLRKREFVKDLKKMPSEYFRNLYFDTSGSKSPASLMGMLEVVDADHVLWGSDLPANQGFAESLEIFSKLSLTGQQKSDIVSNNMKRLLAIR